VISLLLLSSCVYPDIDTVPEFKDVKITKEELMDLCKLNNPYRSPSKILTQVAPVITYRYINNNYKRLKCFEIFDINTNRYGL
jgi:hypothetical protein